MNPILTIFLGTLANHAEYRGAALIPAALEQLTDEDFKQNVKLWIKSMTDSDNVKDSAFLQEHLPGLMQALRDALNGNQLNLLTECLKKEEPREEFKNLCWSLCAQYMSDKEYSDGVKERLSKAFMKFADEFYENLINDPETVPKLIVRGGQNGAVSEPPCLLTEKPGKPEFFLCRDEDLKNLRETLKRSHCVSLSGIGGVGKSTLAKQLFSETWTEYGHAAWVNYNGDLDSSLLGFDWPSDAASPKEKLRQIYEKVLENPNCRTLLVIDNVDEKALQDKGTQGNRFDSFTSSPFLTVVITQRKNVFGNRYYSFPVPELDERQCAEVFKAYYTAEGRSVSPGDEEAIAELIGLAWRNTKVLSIMAKSVRKKNTLQEYVEELKENLNRAGQKAVGDEKLTLPEHMRQLFPISERSEEERRILQTFALMPSVPIPAEVEDWIHAEEETLKTLCDAGLLDFGESEQTRRGFYSMHPLVKETILLDKENPEVFPESIGEDFAACVAEERYVGEKETYDTALPKLTIADGVLTAMGERGTGEYAYACDRLAALHRKYGSYTSGEQWFLKSVRLAETVYGLKHPNTASTYNDLAVLYKAQGKYAEAKENYLKALAIREKELGKEHPDTATTYNNLALLYKAQGKYDKAEEYTLKALAIREKVLGTEHPSTATTYHNLAGLYKAQGKYAEAEENYLKALAIREKELGKEHPDTATTYNNLALLYQAQGKYAEAVAYYLKALAIKEKVLGTEHPDTATICHNLGSLYFAKEDYDTAMEWFEKALPVWLRSFGSAHPYVDNTLSWMRDTFPHTALAETQDFDTWLDSFLTERGIDWRPEGQP